MSALLMGSISTVLDTSELQREAFNKAFKAHDLSWNWDREQYRSMLGSNGGQDRVAEYAKSTGDSVDAAAVHATKSQIFQQSLAGADLHPRDGVLECIAAAKDQGISIGLVTTTSPENVNALLQAIGDTIARDSFDVIIDSSLVNESKPQADSYLLALQHLKQDAGQCIAVEDNVGGVQAARSAGVRCVAFPNDNTGGQDFGSTERVDALDPESLLGRLGGSARGSNE